MKAPTKFLNTIKNHHCGLFPKFPKTIKNHHWVYFLRLWRQSNHHWVYLIRIFSKNLMKLFQSYWLHRKWTQRKNVNENLKYILKTAKSQPTHTHPHTHTHKRTHTQTHTHACTHTHTQVHTNTCTNMWTHTHRSSHIVYTDLHTYPPNHLPQQTLATRGVTVSMSAFLACHQCYCAGSSLAWGLNLQAVVCGIFWSSSPGVFSGYSGFLPSFIGLMIQPTK